MRLRSFYMTFFAPSLPADSSTAVRAVKVMTAIVCLLLSVTTTANQTHSLAELESAVKTFLAQHYADTNAIKLEIQVNSLDPRLQLSRCEQALAMKVNDTHYTGGNLTVHTACEGVSPWSVYVPAQVTIFRYMPVANRNLERGEIVSRVDISSEVVNISQVRQGQLTDAESIVGKEVQRPVAQGDTFRSAGLAAPLVVKRGDLVRIEIQAGAISVASQGTAMSHGRVGDRIRVRNSSSDRIVTAQVIAAGKVQTAM